MAALLTRHELLKHELARVRDVHLRHARAVAAAALERHRVEVGDGDHAALVADVQAVRVRVEEEALLEELRGPVRDDAVCTREEGEGSLAHRASLSAEPATATHRAPSLRSGGRPRERGPPWAGA